MAYKKYYTLVHAITGYTFGMYDSYDAADSARILMDDFELWTVEPYGY